MLSLIALKLSSDIDTRCIFFSFFLRMLALHSVISEHKRSVGDAESRH